MICWGVGCFFPLCRLLLSLLTRNKPLSPLRQRNKQIFVLHITPFFCQFCEQIFLFYSLLNKLFFHHFLLNKLIFQTDHRPPMYHLVGPLTLASMTMRRVHVYNSWNHGGHGQIRSRAKTKRVSVEGFSQCPVHFTKIIGYRPTYLKFMHHVQTTIGNV